MINEDSSIPLLITMDLSREKDQQGIQGSIDSFQKKGSNMSHIMKDIRLRKSRK